MGCPAQTELRRINCAFISRSSAKKPSISWLQRAASISSRVAMSKKRAPGNSFCDKVLITPIRVPILFPSIAAAFGISWPSVEINEN